MAVKEYSSGNAETTKTEYDVERTRIKLGKDQMIDNVVISDCRRGSNDDGEYLIMMLDDIDADEHYMYFNNIGDKAVHGNKVKDTFFTYNEETTYYDVKAAFKDRPIWFAKQSVPGKRWFKLQWGFMNPVEPTASKDAPTPEQSSELPVYDELEINKTLQYAMDNGEDVFGAGELLITRMGMNPSNAIKLAKAFYKAAEDSDVNN